jgi:hypothetical protein
MPTATVVLESFAQVTLVQREVEGVSGWQGHAWQAHHRLVCQALGGDDSWYEGLAP